MVFVLVEGMKKIKKKWVGWMLLGWSMEGMDVSWMVHRVKGF